MKLLSYLNDRFDCLSSKLDIIDHFLEKFGVYVKIEDDLYLFKYGMIEANWNEEITAECRGVILRYNGKGWKVVSRPFDKFFNLGEFKCTLRLNFDDMISDCILAEKADGTCIQYWYDDIRTSWRASTLGTISPLEVYGFPLTFDELFLSTIGDVSSLNKTLDRGHTYLFELCSPMNQIVTEYETPITFLLGIRNITDGSILEYDHKSAVAHSMIENKLNVKLPMHIKHIELNTPDRLMKYADDQANSGIYGKNPEGFVVYHNGTPVAKIKNQRYCHLHRIVGGDSKHTMNVIIESFFEGTIDDIYGDLNEYCKKSADGLRNTYMAFLGSMKESMTKLYEKKFDSRKDFAFFVQKNIPKEFLPFCYQNTDIFYSEYDSVPEKCSEWIRSNYKKFTDIWKTV